MPATPAAGRVAPYRDLRDSASVRGGAEAAVADFGRLDIAVVNAAAVFLGSRGSSFMTRTELLRDDGYSPR